MWNARCLASHINNGHLVRDPHAKSLQELTVLVVQQLEALLGLVCSRSGFHCREPDHLGSLDVVQLLAVSLTFDNGAQLKWKGHSTYNQAVGSRIQQSAAVGLVKVRDDISFSSSDSSTWLDDGHGKLGVHGRSSN